MTKILVNVNKADYARFKKIAKFNDSDTNKEIRKFIKEYLSKNADLALKI